MIWAQICTLFPKKCTSSRNIDFKYGNTDLVSVQLGEPEVGRGHEEPKVLAIGWDLVGAAGRQEAVEVLDRQAAVRAPVHEDAHHPVSLSVK